MQRTPEVAQCNSPVPSEVSSRCGMWLFRGVGILSTLYGVIYLSLRLYFHTIPPSHTIIGSLFFLSEVCIVIITFLLTIVGWHVSDCYGLPLSLRKDIKDPFTYPRVDIFIPVINEPLHIVERTIKAALNITYQCDKLFIYLLDDSEDARFSSLYQQLKSSNGQMYYINRGQSEERGTFAKAGNLNYAMRSQKDGKGDFLLLLDADHVCRPEILDELLSPIYESNSEGNFSLSRVGFIQAPDHSWTSAPGNILLNDANIFYGPIQRALSSHKQAYLIGTSVLIRRAALDEVGGFFQESVTEDVPTGLLMNLNGWHSLYYPQPVSVGMPPTSLATMLRQRQRWSEGEFQYIFLLRKSLFKRMHSRSGLLHVQNFLLNMMRYIFIAFGVLLPTIVVNSHIAFISAPPMMIAQILFPHILLSRLVRVLYAREIRAKNYFIAEQLGLITVVSSIWALLRVILRFHRIQFWLTPKKQASSVSILSIATILVFSPLLYAFICLSFHIYYDTTPMLLIHKLVPLAWTFHFLICAWPLIRYTIVPATIVENYYEISPFEESISLYQRILEWIFLPTNIAPLVTVASCLLTIIGH